MNYRLRATNPQSPQASEAIVSTAFHFCSGVLEVAGVPTARCARYALRSASAVSRARSLSPIGCSATLRAASYPLTNSGGSVGNGDLNKTLISAATAGLAEAAAAISRRLISLAFALGSMHSVTIGGFPSTLAATRSQARRHERAEIRQVSCCVEC